MKNTVNFKRRGLIFFAISIVFVVVSSVINHKGRLSISEEKRYETFQADFLDKEQQFDDLLTKLAASSYITNSTDLLGFCDKNKVDNSQYSFFVYSDSVLVAWSSNQIIPPKHWNGAFSKIAHTDGKWTYTKQLSTPEHQYIGYLIIEDKVSTTNKNEYWTVNDLFAEDTVSKVQDKQHCYTIYNNAGESLFTISLESPLKRNNKEVTIEMILWLIAFTMFLLSLVSFALRIAFFSKNKNILYAIIVGFLVFSSLMLSHLFQPASDLFSPLYYSSHYSSLGLLFCNSYFILLGSSLFMQFFTLGRLKNFPWKMKVGISSVMIFGSFLLFIFVYFIVTGIANDSVVVLKPETIYQYDLFSILAIAAIIFILWSVFIITYKIFNEIFLLLRSEKSFLTIIIIELLFAVIVFSVFYFGLSHKEVRFYVPFLLFILLAIVMSVFITMQKKWHNMMFHCLVYLILSGMVLFATRQTADERENKYKESMAEMMLSIEDPFIFYTFSELAEEIEKDNQLTALFNENSVSISNIQNYLMTNYIKQYAENYRVTIDIGLQSSGKDSANIDHLNRMHPSSSASVTNKNVSFRRIGFGRSEYTVNLSIPIVGGTDVGKVLITFFKIYVSSEQQSELEETLRKEMSNYSYAGYENNVLKMTAGNRNVSYLCNLSEYQLDTVYSGMEFVSEDIKHTAYQYNNMVLLVSTEKEVLWDRVSFVIILFLGQFVFSLLPVLLNSSFQPHNLWQLGFQESIQYYITIIITLTVFTTAFTFARFYRAIRINDMGNAQNQRSAWINRVIRSAISDVDSLSDLSPNTVALFNKELSAFYELDILDLNLYNKQGENVKSYGRGIYFNTHVNPHIFKVLSSNKTDVFVEKEAFNKEKYKSYYRAILNKEGDIIGYTNLFTSLNWQKEIIDYRHTQFLTMFLTICVFLIMLIVLFSMFLIKRFTLPLLKVADKLSNIELGGELKKIEWYRNDEFGQLVDNYNVLVDRLDESVELLGKSSQEMAWRDMARQVAHEIKNPLTPIRLTTQQMIRELSTSDTANKEKLNRYFSMIIQQTDTLTDIATSFSNFAQIDQQDGSSEDLVPVIQNVLSSFDEHPDVAFTFKNYTKKQEIISFVNKSQMSRVFNNLIKNAIQAKKPKETLSVNIEIENYGDKMWQITVMDTGMGMTDEVKEKVFSPNFTTKTSGTGLGLAMTKRIIHNWGGNISFESTSNVGTIFYITLPKYEDEVVGK